MSAATDGPGSAESALIVRLPELEPLVGAFRARHDPAAADGVPAHVTVLYPFLAPRRISAAVLRALRDLFRDAASFTAEFAALRRFPDVLYLAPVDDAPFRALIGRVVAAYPEAPPYGGRFPDPVPHLTIAHAAGEAELDAIAAEVARGIAGRLPVRARVREVVLIENTSGTWQPWAELPLAPSPGG